MPAFEAAEGRLGDAAGLSRGALLGGYTDSQGMLEGALGRSLGSLSPLVDAGIGSLGKLQSGATAGGFANNIEALRTGGALDPLIAENRRNLEAELSAQGLGRSGYGITEMSQLPIETIMGIESQLYGREGNIAGRTLPSLMAKAELESGFGTQMAANRLGYGQGLSALESGLGSDLANIDITRGQNLADIERGIGSSLSSGILAKAQAQAADRGQFNEVMAAERANLHDFGMSMMGSMGGGMGG